AHDQEIELLDTLRRFRAARDRVPAMAHDEHRFHGVGLGDLLLRQQGRIEPARAGNSRRLHEGLAGETREHPIVIDVPYAAPMPPGSLVQAVIERQRRYIEAEIGRALHVVMTAENIGAASRMTDISCCE